MIFFEISRLKQCTSGEIMKFKFDIFKKNILLALEKVCLQNVMRWMNLKVKGEKWNFYFTLSFHYNPPGSGTHFYKKKFLKIITFFLNKFSNNFNNLKKIEIVMQVMDMSRDYTVLLWWTAYNLWTFTWIVPFELFFRLKGTEPQTT